MITVGERGQRDKCVDQKLTAEPSNDLIIKSITLKEWKLGEKLFKEVNKQLDKEMDKNVVK